MIKSCRTSHDKLLDKLLGMSDQFILSVLRHLASGNKYASMKFGWRVPHNTLSLVVREVCQAIIDEYVDEVLVCPSTPDGWRAIAETTLEGVRRSFPSPWPGTPKALPFCPPSGSLSS